MSVDPLAPTQPAPLVVCSGIVDVYHGDADAIVKRGLTLRDAIRQAKEDVYAPLAFLIVKCTQGGKRLGTPYTDPRFAEWIDAATAESVPWGVYHFLTGTDSGAAQADWLAESLRAHGVDPEGVAFVACDYEHNPDGATATPVHAGDFALRWYIANRRDPWLYADESDYAIAVAHERSLGNLRWWGAAYGNHRPAHAALWQYMGAECSDPWEFPKDQVTYPRTMDGLGKVDRSAYVGSAAQFLASLG